MTKWGDSLDKSTRVLARVAQSFLAQRPSKSNQVSNGSKIWRPNCTPSRYEITYNQLRFCHQICISPAQTKRELVAQLTSRIQEGPKFQFKTQYLMEFTVHRTTSVTASAICQIGSWTHVGFVVGTHKPLPLKLRIQGKQWSITEKFWRFYWLGKNIDASSNLSTIKFTSVFLFHHPNFSC